MPDLHFLSSLLFWSAVCFGVLLYLLKRFAFPSIFRVLDEREKRIRGSIDDADRVKLEAEELLAQYREKLKGAQQEVNAVLEKARSQAGRIVEDGRRKMEQQAEQMMQEARTGIERERQDAVKEIREATADLTLLVAEKILERELNDADHQRYVEQVVREVGEGKK
jgi:F-type H+-transporting ATPase subunit b